MQKFYIKYREREKIFQIQAESEQDAIIIAKQLITSKYLLSPESDLTLCVLYTWNEIYERAIDSCCMSPELRAKDEARNQVREFALEKGFEDLEKAEIPEEMVEYYSDYFNLRFDLRGNIEFFEERKKKDPDRDWILTFSNSENADVYFWRFYGGLEEVKKKMLEMAQERSSNTDSELINLPTDPTEIEKNLATDTLICMIGYEDYDYVISAKDFQKINWQFR